jgi:D-xylose transport system ATP-binding protein
MTPCIVRPTRCLARLKLKGVNVAAPVMNYGGGYQQLFEIAKALAKNARLLILDEPSSSLTSSEIDVRCPIIEDLKREGVACVYISHKLEEVAKRLRHRHRDPRRQAHRTKPMSEMTTHGIIAAMVGRDIKNLYPEANTPSVK